MFTDKSKQFSSPGYLSVAELTGFLQKNHADIENKRYKHSSEFDVHVRWDPINKTGQASHSDNYHPPSQLKINFFYNYNAGKEEPTVHIYQKLYYYSDKFIAAYLAALTKSVLFQSFVEDGYPDNKLRRKGSSLLASIYWNGSTLLVNQSYDSRINGGSGHVKKMRAFTIRETTVSLKSWWFVKVFDRNGGKNIPTAQGEYPYPLLTQNLRIFNGALPQPVISTMQHHYPNATLQDMTFPPVSSQSAQNTSHLNATYAGDESRILDTVNFQHLPLFDRQSAHTGIQKYYHPQTMISGKNLHDFAKLKQRESVEITPQEAIDIFGGLLYLLVDLKKQRIVHGDIKPQNIMVEEYPLHTGRLRLRLVDYESAKIVPDGQSEVNGHGKRTIKFFVGEGNSFKFSDDYYAIIRCISLLRSDLGDYMLEFMTSMYLDPKIQLKAFEYHFGPSASIFNFDTSSGLPLGPSASIFSFYNNLLACQHAPFPHNFKFDPSTVNDPNILAYFELTTLHNYIMEQLQRLNIKNKLRLPKWHSFNLLEKNMSRILAAEEPVSPDELKCFIQETAQVAYQHQNTGLLTLHCQPTSLTAWKQLHFFTPSAHTVHTDTCASCPEWQDIDKGAINTKKPQTFKAAIENRVDCLVI